MDLNSLVRRCQEMPRYLIDEISIRLDSLQKHLINKNDVYYSREMIKESRAAKPTFQEIHQAWREPKLASKLTSEPEL